MRRFLILFVLVLPLSRIGAEPAETPQIRTQVVSGTVVTLDPAFLKMSVRTNDGQVQELTLSSVTPITDHAKPISIEKLRVGDRVIATFTEAPFQIVNLEKQ
jgi:hypothetical protein